MPGQARNVQKILLNPKRILFLKKGEKGEVASLKEDLIGHRKGRRSLHPFRPKSYHKLNLLMLWQC